MANKTLKDLIALKWYGYLGLCLIAFAQINFYTVIQPFASWYIVIVWYGFILFIDSLVYRIKGRSLIASYPKEFVFMILISVPFWLIFEFYNLFTHSWYYINYTDYIHFFDFMTILPAVLETFTLINALNIGGSVHMKKFRHAKAGISKFSNNLVKAIAALGTISLLLPIVLGPIGFVFMWVSLCLFFDPINYLTGRPSLIQKASEYGRGILIRISLAGFIMGFFWEFWNYQAYPKWAYTLPYPIFNVKIFAMPVEGYIGYAAFAAAAYLFYAFFRYPLFKGRNDLLSM